MDRCVNDRAGKVRCGIYKVRSPFEFVAFIALWRCMFMVRGLIQKEGD